MKHLKEFGRSTKLPQHSITGVWLGSEPELHEIATQMKVPLVGVEISASATKTELFAQLAQKLDFAPHFRGNLDGLVDELDEFSSRNPGGVILYLRPPSTGVTKGPKPSNEVPARFEGFIDAVQAATKRAADAGRRLYVLF